MSPEREPYNKVWGLEATLPRGSLMDKENPMTLPDPAEVAEALADLQTGTNDVPEARKVLIQAAAAYADSEEVCGAMARYDSESEVVTEYCGVVAPYHGRLTKQDHDFLPAHLIVPKEEK